MRHVAMKVVVYRTQSERIAYAEHVIHRSLNTSFGIIERQRKSATLDPIYKVALFQAAQERKRLEWLIARWRVELTN
jgi:hypothetical protein